MAKVTIYSTPTCTFCHLAKSFFKENNVQYEDFDVSSDPQKLEEMKEKVKDLGQIGVPVIEIDGEVMIGFNEPKIREILKI